MTQLIRDSVCRMTGYVPGEQPVDPGLIKLNTNENPYPPTPAVAEALKGLTIDDLRLYPDPVCTPLRKRVAELSDCDVDHVFIGNGSDEILALATRAFVDNDGTIGFFDPSYSLYPVLADIRDARQIRILLDAAFNWPTDAGDQAADCSLFFISNPNAPTGRLAPTDQIRAFCERVNGVVIVDEAYVDFADDTCLDLAASLDNVMVLRTLSKSFSLAGLRLGYAVGHPALIEALFTIKDSYNVDRFCQILALAALSDMAYMRQQAETIRRTRARLTSTLEELEFTVIPSQANFIWTKPAGITAKELFDRLREDRILIRYFAGDVTGDYVRITIGTDDEIDRLCDAVTRILS